MTNWDDKARDAYHKRVEEAEQRSAVRLATMLSNIIGETIPPSGQKIKLNGRAALSFVLEHEDSEFLSVALGCQVCQTQYYQQVTSLADIGDILINGKKPHENCRKVAAPTKLVMGAGKME